MAVGADVDVVQIDFAIFDAREAVAQIDAPFADGLHFGTQQDHPRLECLEEVIIVGGLAVFRDVGLRLLAVGFVDHGWQV